MKVGKQKVLVYQQVRMRELLNIRCHGVGDDDARQTDTATECTLFDAGHGIGDGNTRQTATAHERLSTDAGHGVGISIVRDRFGNNDVSG